MGIVSAFTLIRAISLFHITAGYFFLVSPRTMVEQNMVILLGESMHLVPSTVVLSKQIAKLTPTTSLTSKA